MEDVATGLVRNVSRQHASNLRADPITFYITLASSGPNFLFDLPAGSIYGLCGITLSDQTLPEVATSYSPANSFQIVG
ncbi:hypothetical protein GO755_08235 [Spirosoma sp. HMF4905]|uniref:Uncharacterized protein n=1 Tax=Spirosoma arboris TaxID=2682092 RepID=A0A7K1S8A5_9BACT|nr:hypothetical protein [Spirosoma arboris]MVM30017.1 hypothetical protein [Spirosoma arboris]